MTRGLNYEDWRRCELCGLQLVRVTDQRQLLKHAGHHLRPAPYIRFWEWVWIKLGVL